MVDQKSLFRPRKSERKEASGGKSVEHHSTAYGSIDLSSSAKSNGIIELTKTSKYCVSKLPASPSILSASSIASSGSSPGGILNGYTDHFSSYSLVINNDSINVWSYKSTDATPLSIQFPVREDSANGSPLPPLAILTKPINTYTDDPGLMIIDSTSGHVKFYESVQHAPALGLINNKSLELTVPLKTSHGEYITLAENVEPAGIVIATSLKRCVLVGFKDFFSKPRLSLTELIPPVSGNTLGLLSNIFSSRSGSSSDVYSKDLNEEIVSIKTSDILDQGMAQEIFIQDNQGGYYFFSLQLVTPDSGAIIDKKHSFKQYISTCIESSIEGYSLPGSSNKINLLDIWPLRQEESKPLKDIHIALCEIEPSMGAGAGEKSEYALVTLKINKTGVLYYGTHKLNKSFNIPSVKPRLFLPKPGNVAFVIIGNSIILTDVNPSYIESNSSPYYYNQRRWEDIIRLKPSVQIVGQGYEDESSDSNPSIILLTNNSGVLRVEKFGETGAASGMEIDVDPEDDAENPIATIMSHIEQGIFFSNSSDELDFDLLDVESCSHKSIKLACAQIIDSILNSTSPYLPVFLPSIKDFLNLKMSLFQSLISYVKRNFPEIWNVLVSNIVEKLEKIAVGLQLWTFVEVNGGKVLEILKRIIQKYVNISNQEAVSDPVRFFLNHKLQYVNQVLNDFVATLVNENISLTLVNELLVNTLYFGVFRYEEQYILQEPEIESRKLWIFDTDLIINVEEIFRTIYCGGTSKDLEITSEKLKTNNSQLCEALYYFVTSAVQYMQHFDSANQQQLKDYLKWYNSSKTHWIKSLLSRGLEVEAIRICEKYHDLSSLVVVLASEENRGMLAYDEYFDKFGYEFASSLYDFYLANDKINSLLLEFENYRPFLMKYFQENPRKTCQISWIRDFLDGNFVAGSSTLRTSSLEYADERIENKELKFSLAKLSAIAAAQSPNNDVDMIVDTEESLTDSNNNLVAIRIQNKLYRELSRSIAGNNVEGDDLLTFNYVSKHFSNELIDSVQFKSLIEEPLSRLSTKKLLTPVQLIDLLTLLKPTINSGKNFAYALRITSLITNDSIYREQCRLVWLRLLTITDKWGEITLTENETDEGVKLKFTNSILFKTFQKIGTDNDLVQQLDAILGGDQSVITSHDDLTTDLLSKLSVYIRENNLPTWVKSIKSEVGNV
ncbi:nucleoporin Nup133p [[Candida] railenensis]|uniref:Nucleoporin Nup133p n=1 Tax=[Candida] railenensis TaxID=45579 RepID=A0A9P0QRR9_9ASCO|nr:nucleoporin Nup133p [[Candida] railenensis]